MLALKKRVEQFGTKVLLVIFKAVSKITMQKQVQKIN
jgi:hypothetical protein